MSLGSTFAFLRPQAAPGTPSSSLPGTGGDAEEPGSLRLIGIPGEAPVEQAADQIQSILKLTLISPGGSFCLNLWVCLVFFPSYQAVFS